MLRAIKIKAFLQPNGNMRQEEKVRGCDLPQFMKNPTGPISGLLPFMWVRNRGATDSF
jgi:hypothetical protein